MHYCSKVWGQNFLIQINTFIQKLHNKLMKSGNKDTYNATKHLYLKKILFLWTFYSPENSGQK